MGNAEQKPKQPGSDKQQKGCAQLLKDRNWWFTHRTRLATHRSCAPVWAS